MCKLECVKSTLPLFFFFFKAENRFFSDSRTQDISFIPFLWATCRTPTLCTHWPSNAFPFAGVGLHLRAQLLPLCPGHGLRAAAAQGEQEGRGGWQPCQARLLHAVLLRLSPPHGALLQRIFAHQPHTHPGLFFCGMVCSFHHQPQLMCFHFAQFPWRSLCMGCAPVPESSASPCVLLATSPPPVPFAGLGGPELQDQFEHIVLCL